MDTSAQRKLSSLIHCGVALLCVLFMVSGCQQLVRQPAETGADPELAELAKSLSGAAEAKELRVTSEPAVLPKLAQPPATGKEVVPVTAEKTEPAVQTAVKQVETAAPAAAPKAGSSAPAAAVKVEESTSVKKVESAIVTTQAAITPVSTAKTEQATAVTARAGEESTAPVAETVPKAAEVESIEITPIPQPAAEPNSEDESQELTAIIIGGKQIVISEPLPVRSLNVLPELKGPAVAFDTMPLAASNPGAVTSPPAEPANGQEEGKKSTFRGLLGYGRSAVGYAADHYIVLGSVALAAPAVFIFARKKKFFLRRTLRKMNLED